MKLRDHLEKLDSAAQRITEILSNQHEQIVYHIKRTDLLEENIDLLRQQIEPIRAQMAAFNMFCKAFTLGVTMLGAALGLIEAYLRLKGLH